MLYHLLYPLHTEFSAFNVIRYLSFRSLAAALTALLVSFVLGPALIRWLRARHIGQQIRDDGPKSHIDKAGTPTMGGVLIIVAVITATLLWVEFDNPFVSLPPAAASSATCSSSERTVRRPIAASANSSGIWASRCL